MRASGLGQSYETPSSFTLSDDHLRSRLSMLAHRFEWMRGRLHHCLQHGYRMLYTKEIVDGVFLSIRYFCSLFHNQHVLLLMVTAFTTEAFSRDNHWGATSPRWRVPIYWLLVQANLWTVMIHERMGHASLCRTTDSIALNNRSRDHGVCDASIISVSDLVQTASHVEWASIAQSCRECLNLACSFFFLSTRSLLFLSLHSQHAQYTTGGARIAR